MCLMSNDSRPDPADVASSEEALVLGRLAGDTGIRTDLDEVIRAFGFDRAELEAEMVAEEGFVALPPGRALPVTGSSALTALDNWNF